MRESHCRNRPASASSVVIDPRAKRTERAIADVARLAGAHPDVLLKRAMLRSLAVRLADRFCELGQGTPQWLLNVGRRALECAADRLSADALAAHEGVGYRRLAKRLADERMASPYQLIMEARVCLAIAHRARSHCAWRALTPVLGWRDVRSLRSARRDAERSGSRIGALLGLDVPIGELVRVLAPRNAGRGFS